MRHLSSFFFFFPIVFLSCTVLPFSIPILSFFPLSHGGFVRALLAWPVVRVVRVAGRCCGQGGAEARRVPQLGPRPTGTHRTAPHHTGRGRHVRPAIQHGCGKVGGWNNLESETNCWFCSWHAVLSENEANTLDDSAVHCSLPAPVFPCSFVACVWLGERFNHFQPGVAQVKSRQHPILRGPARGDLLCVGDRLLPRSPGQR